MAASNQKWQIVRSALESWSRTIRLCLILLIIGVLTCAEIWTLQEAMMRHRG